MAVKTIQELIDAKVGIDEKRNKEYTIVIKGFGDIKYKLATRTEVVNIQDMDRIDIDPYLIFTHVTEPKLNDVELQKAYGLVGLEPFKIVDKLFNADEIGKLSLAIVDRTEKDLLKHIKN